VSDSYRQTVVAGERPAAGTLAVQVFNRIGSMDRYRVRAEHLDQQLRSEFEVDHNVTRVEVWTLDDEGEAFTARYERTREVR
jgi:hypothetical protein